MTIYGELKAQGKDPKVNIHTWELFDKSFSFPRVRRYELVQKHMDILEHFQDNLNQNFSNGQAVDNFIRVAHEAEEAFNDKYGSDGGGFHDPANFDPQAPVDVTWYNVYGDDSHAMPTGIERGDGQI